MKLNQKLAAVLAACVLWCASASTSHAQCAAPSARILRLDGVVEHKAASAPRFTPAAVNLDVCLGDAIRTGERSRVTMVFQDNTRLIIDQNTEWVVHQPTTPARTLIELIRGAILFFARQPRSLDVKTPFVNAAVEGTEFLVRVESDRTFISVFEGHVSATNAQGSLALTRDESAIAMQGQAPQKQVIIRPRDAVQWALYYEPILPADSLEQLDKVASDQRDARFYVRRASVLLGAGRLDEARADLDRAATLNPEEGDVDALRTTIAVAQNDRAAALASGREAVRRSPKSAAARLALSYALQANLQLEEARDELQQAVKDHPDDGRGWARLSELWLSLGYLDRASEAANRAAALPPEQARTRVVLGYAALERVDIAAATTAFERAISLEPDNPLARLGLGLTRIREGHLAEGRREIEIAAALSPENPIVRSYLGKAYFDERRETESGAQYETAQKLDPLDPTPWFYDAIRKQTINRPVEALQDFEKAIDLNDNRAVYRSSFLLDQDLAARSASLGRLYRDLGFEQLAPVEAWKSVDADSADYSGHRLLADTYSALPRHEIARVSELLQSQLLQPINITPVPAGLSEPEPFVLEGAGPSEPAFNEFNPLFNRNRLAFLANGSLGNEGVLGDELTVSGVWNRLSFSASQFHYDADGFRENNEQNRDLYNAFFQAQVSSATSIQAEFRSEDVETGDVVVNFDPTDFEPVQTSHADGHTARLGVRHAFNPRSVLIASLYSRNRNEAFAETLTTGGFVTENSFSSRVESWTGEVRHILRTRRLTLNSGLGYFHGDRTRDGTVNIPDEDPELSFTFTTHDHDTPEHTNAYVYSSVHVSERITLTIGASADFYRRSLLKRNLFNPKLGLTWRPAPKTTVRLAAFRTLNRALVSSQTIEPTEVAGFNQLFADREGDEARRAGAALDQKIGDRVYAGVEYSRRWLNIPVEFANEFYHLEQNLEGHEQLGRSYFYWAPTRRVALSAEYFYEQSERSAAATGEEAFLSIRTHRVPLSIRYFGQNGLLAHVTATAIDQSGAFFIRGLLTDGASRFWVVDGAIGYRLPRRYGRILLEVKNLFDKQFNFQDVDPGNPETRPGRLVVLRAVVGL